MKRNTNIITIYDKDHVANYKANVYQTQGLGTLPDATEAFVEGEFQSLMVLHLRYPEKGRNSHLLKEERIIQTKVSDGNTQLMRIYEVKKSINGNDYLVLAEPVFNTVRRHYITSLQSDLLQSIDAAWQKAVAAVTPAIDTTVFNIQVNPDALNSMATINFEQGNLLQFIGGKEGSLLDYRNPLEFEKDNSTLIVGRKIGREHAMTAVYKRNLTGLDYTINTQGVVTAYYPFAKIKPETEGSQEEEEILLELNPKVIVLDSAKNYVGVTKTLDFSDDETVTDVASLKKAYDAYFAANEAERTPTVQVTVDMVSLRNQKGYEQFISWQSIKLGDYVDVIHNEWGMTLSARVVKYTYNIITDRYDKLELGDVTKTFIDNINNNINDSTNGILDEVRDIINGIDVKGETQELLEDMANQITGHSGGNVVLDPPTRPERILIMDTDNIDTAKNIIMFNELGILMGQEGVNGNFSSAWTIDGIFNAKWIQTGILSGNNLRINLDTGEVTFQKGFIRDAAENFVIDVTTGHLYSRGLVDSPQGTGNKVIAGFDLTNGELSFRSSTWDDTTVAYGGIYTKMHLGSYRPDPNRYWERGTWFGGKPTITLMTGDAKEQDGVLNIYKRAVAMATDSFISPTYSMITSGTTSSGYSHNKGTKDGDQFIAGAVMGVYEESTSSAGWGTDLGGRPTAEAVILARTGVRIAGGYSDTINDTIATYQIPSIVLGGTSIDESDLELQSLVNLASSIVVQAGYQIRFTSRNQKHWIGKDDQWLISSPLGKNKMMLQTSSIEAGYNGGRGAAGMTFGESDSRGGKVYSRVVYGRGMSGAANVVVDSSGILGRSTSARRYKTDIIDATNVMAKAHRILELNPREWFDRRELREKGTSERYYGFIADEFHELGLNEVVTYDEQGRPDALAYDRIAIYLLPLIKELYSEINSLKMQLKG